MLNRRIGVLLSSAVALPAAIRLDRVGAGARTGPKLRSVRSPGINCLAECVRLPRCNRGLSSRPFMFYDWLHIYKEAGPFYRKGSGDIYQWKLDVMSQTANGYLTDLVIH